MTHCQLLQRVQGRCGDRAFIPLASSQGDESAILLIRCCVDVNDLLGELNLHFVPQQVEPQQLDLREELPANDDEARLLALLDPLGEPRHIDDLCRATGLPIATVSGALVMMELKGLALLVGPMTYARAR